MQSGSRKHHVVPTLATISASMLFSPLWSDLKARSEPASRLTFSQQDRQNDSEFENSSQLSLGWASVFCPNLSLRLVQLVPKIIQSINVIPEHVQG